jgi:hypothetical protein
MTPITIKVSAPHESGRTENLHHRSQEMCEVEFEIQIENGEEGYYPINGLPESCDECGRVLRGDEIMLLAVNVIKTLDDLSADNTPSPGSHIYSPHKQRFLCMCTECASPLLMPAIPQNIQGQDFYCPVCLEKQFFIRIAVEASGVPVTFLMVT